MDLKRGMSGFDHAGLKLAAANYLVQHELPAVPKSFGYVRHNNYNWQMLGNNEVGNCVMAGAAHQVDVWYLGRHSVFPPFNTDVVKAQYFELTGGKDEGLDPVKTSQWLHATGIADGRRVRHRVAEYAAIDTSDFDQLDLMCFIFGCVGVGVNMPDGAEDDFECHRPWSDTSKPPPVDSNDIPTHGHYLVYCGKNSHGGRMFVTWGALQEATEAWLAKYMLGAIGFFSMEFLDSKGLSPQMIDVAGLKTDFAAVQRA